METTPDTANITPVVSDEFGHIAGQTWDHNGFAIEAKAITTGDNASALEFIASESAISQATHARNFRYTQTFTTLQAAQEAIDDANRFPEPPEENEDGDMINVTPNGTDDTSLKAKGWQRMVRPQ